MFNNFTQIKYFILILILTISNYSFSSTKTQICTVSGQSVYEKRNPTTIQVNGLQRGVYIVQIHTLNNEVLTTKLVVR